MNCRRTSLTFNLNPTTMPKSESTVTTVLPSSKYRLFVDIYDTLRTKEGGDWSISKEGLQAWANRIVRDTERPIWNVDMAINILIDLSRDSDGTATITREEASVMVSKGMLALGILRGKECA